MIAIKDIHAEEILDSRKSPTLRVTVETAEGSGTFEVPSGASTGSREVVELRDFDRGMDEAIDQITKIVSKKLVGMDVCDQEGVDSALHELDDSADFATLGGNVAIGVSIAAAKAAAQAQSISISEHIRAISQIRNAEDAPRLFVNLINGGKHAKGGSSLQEHHIIPDTDDVREALAIAEQMQDGLVAYLGAEGISYTQGDEGGYAFAVHELAAPFEILERVAERAGLSGRMYYGIDCAASSFYDGGLYEVLGSSKTTRELLDVYKGLTSQFDIRYIEDPFFEDDIKSFTALRDARTELLVVGDDLTTTDAERIQDCSDAGAINGVIIKPNQIGTLSATLEAIAAATEDDVAAIVSHRSGETMDDFISHLVCATSAYGLKAGAPRSPERRIKYTSLIENMYGN